MWGGGGKKPAIINTPFEGRYARVPVHGTSTTLGFILLTHEGLHKHGTTGISNVD